MFEFWGLYKPLTRVQNTWDVLMSADDDDLIFLLLFLSF